MALYWRHGSQAWDEAHPVRYLVGINTDHHNLEKHLTATVTNCILDGRYEVSCENFCLAVREVYLMDEKPGAVMTIEELSAYLKIPKSTLYKLVREGKVPSQKVGRHWRFRKEAIDRWLDETQAEEPDTKGEQ